MNKTYEKKIKDMDISCPKGDAKKVVESADRAGLQIKKKISEL